MTRSDRTGRPLVRQPMQHEHTTPLSAMAPPIDDPGMRVIWPRHWYTAHGETMRMFA